MLAAALERPDHGRCVPLPRAGDAERLARECRSAAGTHRSSSPSRGRQLGGLRDRGRAPGRGAVGRRERRE
eukprot:10605033-Alexandrium_andersonii.AAC.1